MQLVPSIQGFGRLTLISYPGLRVGAARHTWYQVSPLLLSLHPPFSAGTVLVQVSTPLSSKLVSLSNHASVPQHLYLLTYQ